MRDADFNKTKQAKKKTYAWLPTSLAKCRVTCTTFWDGKGQNWEERQKMLISMPYAIVLTVCLFKIWPLQFGFWAKSQRCYDKIVQLTGIDQFITEELSTKYKV